MASATGLAASLRGRLVAGGEPVVAELLVQSVTGAREIVGRGSTVTAGEFVLVIEAGSYRVRVRVAGAGVPREFAFGTILLAPGQVLEIGDLVVPAAANIRGRVIDEVGVPLAGVAVQAKTGNGPWQVDLLGGPDARDAPHAPDAVDDLEVRSDSAGQFVLEGLLPGSVRVRAEHPDCYVWQGSLDVGLGREGFIGDLVLRAAAPLRGFVVDADGAPLPGAVVTPGGGRNEPLQRRASVRSGSNGGFELRGFGKRNQLTVEAAGCASVLLEDVSGLPRPIQVRLPRAIPLIGRVDGGGGVEGVLQVHALPGDYRDWPGCVDEVLYRDHRVAADGSFAIEHLPAGTWQVEARVPGVGATAPLTVELPLREPLRLLLVPYHHIEVVVVDDLGAPVPGALVVCVEPRELPPLPIADPAAMGQQWLMWGERHEAHADERGVADVLVPAHANLGLAVTAPQHLHMAVAVPRGTLPATLSIVLPRGGIVRGRVIDARMRQHLRMSVELRRASSPTEFAGGMQVDAVGGFVSRAMLPGIYRIGLLVTDATHFGDHEVPVLSAVPLLHDFASVVPHVEVEVRAGQEAWVEISAPPVGEVNGRVLAAGQPVADAIVYGSIANDDDHIVDREKIDAFDCFPHCRSDREGRFRFFVSIAGAIELRARRTTGAAWTGPVVLQAPLAGAIVQRDIVMQAAAIRGTFDTSALAPADREFFTAQMYCLVDAAADPFYCWDLSVPLEWGVQRLPLGKTGTFAFEGLPPGAWVLRFVDRSDTIVLQRVFHTVADEVFELGRLELPQLVSPQLACGLDGTHGVWWRLAVDGSVGAFVATVTIGEQGHWQWPRVPPGRYRLQAFKAGAFPFGFGVTGEPNGDAVEVEVRADGSTVPAQVWPR
ncbi:MAG: carboxypeptidase regulatory-like domain-containing protein [Planctomycetota bacterium]